MSKLKLYRSKIYWRSQVSTKNPKRVMKENWIVNNPIAGQLLRHHRLCEIRTYPNILKSGHIQTFWSPNISKHSDLSNLVDTSIDWTAMSQELNFTEFHVSFNIQKLYKFVLSEHDSLYHKQSMPLSVCYCRLCQIHV